MRAFVYLVLALLIMFSDHYSLRFQKFHDKLSIIVLPIQMLVDAPIKTVHWLAITISTQKDLLAENAELKAQALFLKSQLQKLLALEKENKNLRQLLESKPYIGGKTVVAQLLAVDLDPTLQQVILDKGRRDKVYVGQPVLDPYGIMGQIIQVGFLTSKMLMITDTHSAVPVEDYRTNMRAIAVGSGQIDQLFLINVPNTSDVQVGDLFVSSGLGLRFPIGYPVGVVTQVEKPTGVGFAKIILKPTAHLNRTQQVLLMWPEQAALKPDVMQQLQNGKVGAIHESPKHRGNS